MTTHESETPTKEQDPITTPGDPDSTITPEDPKAIKEAEEEKYFLEESGITDNTKESLYREPLTHIKNRSPVEGILGTCFGDFNAKLTNSQLELFYKLKEDANVLFDAKCTDYDDLFRELWDLLTDKEPLEKLENNKWKDFGFQNANPRSDMRGGGLMSLKQLLSYVKQRPEKVKEMVDPANDFFFAVSSINVTYFLFRYYHMSDLLVYEKDWKEICSRIALKTFCTVLEADNHAFDKIHALLLEDLFATWLEVRKTLPNATILDFNLAQEAVKERYRKATMKKVFEDLDTLKVYYKKKKGQIPAVKSSPTKK